MATGMSAFQVQVVRPTIEQCNEYILRHTNSLITISNQLKAACAKDVITKYCHGTVHYTVMLFEL